MMMVMNSVVIPMMVPVIIKSPAGSRKPWINDIPAWSIHNDVVSQLPDIDVRVVSNIRPQTTNHWSVCAPDADVWAIRQRWFCIQSGQWARIAAKSRSSCGTVSEPWQSDGLIDVTRQWLGTNIAEAGSISIRTG